MRRLPHDRAVHPRPAGFSLIELLVVIGIIVLLIGILVPTLGAVRSAARKTQAQALSSQVVNAMTSFKADKRRLPGYFSAQQMASTENWGGVTAAPMSGPGFTETENVLLELLGGIQDDGVGPDPSQERFSVGPSDDDVVVVSNPAAKGSSSYLKLDSQTIFAVAGQAGHPGGRGEQSDEFATDHPSNYVDLIDPFGMPLLIWKSYSPIRASASDYSLTAISYEDAPTSFYWSTNAGYLASNRLGRDSVNLRQQAGVANPSLIGGGDTAVMGDIQLSLAGLVSSPGFASIEGDMSDLFRRNTPGSADDFARPSAFRGDVIVHSAGVDKIYFAKRQDPGLSEGSDGGQRHVGYLRINRTANPPAPESGSGEAERFDDVIVSGG